MITIAMLPATYTAAMICKSCSDLIAVLCMSQLLSNYCTLTFGLVTQVLPVSSYAAAVLQSCQGSDVAPWLSRR